ncbi:ABC transporter substrate-binding protein [Pumilibacter muris]|uniref:ABC transporter substrate-binding protein n=1 Tax=Pumilibacter muris TaxID=2941510 RepID=UPI00203B786F|nr:extracellular solute-binding protein [Pumilibacter muris]
MKKFRKFFAAIAASLMLCLALTSLSGCFYSPEVPIDELMKEVLSKVDFNADTNYKGTLKVALMDDIASADSFNALKTDFENKYKNIKVEVETFPDLISRVVTMHGAATTLGKYDSMPDIIWVANEDIPGLVSSEVLMPIDYFDEADKEWDTTDLVQSMVQDSYFKKHMYMMPRDYNQIALLYNTAMFAEAKAADSTIKSPDEFKDENGKVRAMTQAEFTEVAKKVQAWMASTQKYKAGKAVDFRSIWGSLNYAISRNFGATIIDSDSNCTLSSEETVNMFDYLVDMVYNNVMTGPNETEGFDFFASERAAMCFQSRACLSDVIAKTEARNGVYENLNVAPMPCLGDDDKYSIGAGCSGYAMYRNAVHATEAWLFLKNIVSESAQEAFSACGNGVPVVQSLLDDEDAAWRNLAQVNEAKYGKLRADFNHDAFVYRRDAATTMEFKKYVPTTIVTEICSTVNGVFVDLLSLEVVVKGDKAKTRENIASKLNGFRKDINSQIRKAPLE